jgi:dihydroflavonol-4-reductase
MKVALVTGGTGFVGSTLAKALLQGGWQVRILRREHSDLRAIGNTDVEHRFGDVRDLGSLKRALGGVDVVFHTAALVSYRRRERETMYETNIGGTRNVVQACLEGGVGRLVHTSSIAAIGFTPDGSPADETTEFNWGSYDVGYRISKHEAELEVKKGVKDGLDAVIVNPAIIIGPGDIHMHGGQLIRDVYKWRIFYYVSGGMNVVSVDDVVQGHLAAYHRGRTGERYILGGENLTHKEVFTTIAKLLHRPTPLFRLPNSIARAVAASAERYASITMSKPWVTRELIAGLGTFSWYSVEKAKKELDYSFVPLKEIIPTTADWFRSHNML